METRTIERHGQTLRLALRSPGTCRDCGWHKPVRTITFWATGLRYRVCEECERPYRHAINWPVQR